MTITVYDSASTVQQWRTFTVVPEDPAYVARCDGRLHQFPPDRNVCACGKVRRRR